MEKRKSVRLVLILLGIVCISVLGLGFSRKGEKKMVYSSELSQPLVADSSDFRNFYGIAWRGKAHDNLAYAKQMGYDYVYYQRGMELDPLSNGLHFYVETPEYHLYNYNLNTTKVFTDKEISFYENYCTLKNNSDRFPLNLATGWHSDKNVFTPILDFQQQKVITWAIDSALSYVRSIELRNPRFRFAGFGWDEPRPTGDFWESSPLSRRPATLSNWVASDFGAVRSGATHNFSTYTDGHMAYYKQIYAKTRVKYPNAKFFSEPSRIYEDWIMIIKNRKDAKAITPDILSQERQGTQFVDDDRIFSSGLIKKSNVYCTSPDVFDEAGNRLIAAKAAINGAWFGWFGRFGGTGNMPNYQNITEVPPRLKLIRMLPNWENRNGTPLTQRMWDGNIYRSNTAFASVDAISVLQPNTKKLFVVFLTAQGKVRIPNGFQVTSIFRTNNLFIENGDGAADIAIQSSSVVPRNLNCLEKGFILQLK